MPSRTRHAATKAKTRRNPNALYWKVGQRIPWKPWRSSPKALQTMLRSNDVNLSRLGTPQRSSRPSGAKRSAATRTHTVAPVKRATAKPALVIRQLSRSRPAAKRGKPTKRNPPGMIAGIGEDFAGLGAVLSDLGRNPKGFLWLGGGAAGTMIAGGIIGAQLGRVLPEMQPGMARMVNAATYAGTAIVLSRLPRDVMTRRQMLAGGLAIALWELAQPGATAPLVAKIPGVGPLIMSADTQAMVRSPALQANPTAQAAAVAANAPWYKAGGKVNPLNWLSGVSEGEPISVDGIAGDDGEVYRLADEDDQLTAVSVAGDDDSNGMSVTGVGDTAPLMTYLGGLGCPLNGRGNGLTQMVRV